MVFSMPDPLLASNVSIISGNNVHYNWSAILVSHSSMHDCAGLHLNTF